jgi:hypothetical protein
MPHYANVGYILKVKRHDGSVVENPPAESFACKKLFAEQGV